MAERKASDTPAPLEGEDITSAYWEDARHWLSVYADLLRFKQGLLARIAQQVSNLASPARQAASVDLTIIADQMEGYQQRLDLWYRRLWDLHGLWIDPDTRVIRHQGYEATLTRREHQLLSFLVNHPHRYYTAVQILDQAWSDPALSTDEVRNYVRRVRLILKQAGIPARLLNRAGRGYSLVFDGAGRE